MDILRNERSGQQAPAQTAAAPQHAPRHEENPYTTLGKDTEFKGTLSFKEGLKIEGKFEGDISSEGKLIVGKTGEVKAEISVGSITVEGKITGNIVANELVELRSSAELRGDIVASKLKIEEGVVFVGASDVQSNEYRKGGSAPKQHAQPKQHDEQQKKDDQNKPKENK